MARNLVNKGFPVTAFDLNESALDQAVEYGAERATTAAEAAKSADIAITMLPNSPHEEAAVLGAGGRIRRASGGEDPDRDEHDPPGCDEKIGEQATARGIKMIDAPVSGSSVGAIDGTLTMMVGGDADVFERCRPVLQAMGSNVIHVASRNRRDGQAGQQYARGYWRSRHGGSGEHRPARGA